VTAKNVYQNSEALTKEHFTVRKSKKKQSKRVRADEKGRLDKCSSGKFENIRKN